MRALVLLAFVVAGCGGSDVSRSVGARCERTSDCADRCLGPSGDYPEGFCTVDCTSHTECGVEGYCAYGTCVPRCVSGARDCDHHASTPSPDRSATSSR